MIRKHMQRKTEKMYKIKSRLSFSETNEKRKQEEKSKYIEQKNMKKIEREMRWNKK